MSVKLTTDLQNPEAKPWFLWDDPMTVAEVRRVLDEGSDAARLRLLARILREARDTEVWAFTTPREVIREWDRLAPMLGRRRAFWAWLLDAWRAQGLLDGASCPDSPPRR